MKKGAYFLLTIANGLLMFVLVNSIKTQIEFNNHTLELESQIKEKLMFIRDFQKVFKSQNGSYAKSWVELSDYARYGNIHTIEKAENISFDPISNLESASLTYDTINSISVLDSIFVKSIYRPETLSKVPGFEETDFKITTNVLNYGSSEIETIQVLCPIAFNPKSKRQKLQFGSLERPTLAGNWD